MSLDPKKVQLPAKTEAEVAQDAAKLEMLVKTMLPVFAPVLREALGIDRLETKVDKLQKTLDGIVE